MAQPILVVHSRPKDGREDEFNQWYSDVHLPEVLRVDGFVAARRYRFVPDPALQEQPMVHPYLAIYEVEEGCLDEARRALADALAASRVAVKKGRTPELVTSDSLERDMIVAWYEPVSEA